MIKSDHVYKKGRNVNIFHWSISWTLLFNPSLDIYILRFHFNAWDCEVDTLLNFRGNMIYASLFLTFVKKFICVAIHLVHILIKSRRDGLLCGPGVGVSSYIFGYKRTAEIFKTPPIHIFNIFENHTHSYIFPLKSWPIHIFHNSVINVINAGDEFNTH